MDTSDDIAADLSPLEQRRAALRALSDDIMDAIKLLPKPQSWLEGDRTMRCLGTADRVTVQLFSKVRAHTPAERRHSPALSVRPAATVSASRSQAPVSPVYDEDEIDADMPAEDRDGGQALDAALDDMEARLDAIDRGEAPAPVHRPAVKLTATTGRDTPYQTLAAHLALGRDLLMELNAASP